MPDSTVVTFGDSGIEAAVQSDLGITGPITVGDIRNFNKATLDIGTAYNELTVTGTLAGMQYLQYLPKTTLISLWTNFANANIDLTPLTSLHFSVISVNISDMSAADLTPLLQIDPSQISQVNLISSIAGVQYQKNPLGMTNAQLAMLAPWLAKIDSTDVLNGGQPKYFDFSDGALTDFSPLKDFTKPVTIAAGGQSVTVGQVVNFVTGQPGTFTAIPLTGVDGENLTSKFENTWNGTDISKTAATETALVSLGNGEFEIPTAYAATNGANWFAYGFRGMPYSNGNPADYLMINYSNGVQLEYDIMVYQAANWETAPSISASFTDENGQTIAPAINETSAEIGDKFDLSQQATIPGYTLLTDYSSATTGTYTENPQYLEFRYEADPVVAGGLTIQYLDPDGDPIVAPESISGDVGTSYTSTPATIGNYVFEQVASDSAPVSGTLPLAKGTITYEYAPVTVERIINYVDGITGKNIGSTTITVPYEGSIPDPTTAAIAGYVAKGYQLAKNGFPTDGSAFSSATPIKSYLVQFTHQDVTLKPGDTLPADVSLTRAVNQTINFNYADGQTAAPSVTRQVQFTRNAVQDKVTGAVQYTAWQPTGTAGFAVFDVPELAGYQANMAQIAAVPVTATSADLTHDIIYTPKAGRVTVDYYLAHSTKAIQPSTELSGQVATAYHVTAPAVPGYHLVANEPTTASGSYTTPDETVAFYYVPDHATAATKAPVVTTVSTKTKAARPTVTPMSMTAKKVVTQPKFGPTPMSLRSTAVYQGGIRQGVVGQRVTGKHTPAKVKLAQVTTLPQTSEHPANVWGLLALTTLGLFGMVRLRRER